jgi:hypothetical protein
MTVRRLSVTYLHLGLLFATDIRNQEDDMLFARASCPYRRLLARHEAIPRLSPNKQTEEREMSRH